MRIRNKKPRDKIFVPRFHPGPAFAAATLGAVD